MRNYQRRKNSSRLPQVLYKRMRYLVKDYERIREIADGAPDGTRRETALRNCAAIEQALVAVPDEYRDGIMAHICHDAPYPMDAGTATYARWQSRLLHAVAENVNEI